MELSIQQVLFFLILTASFILLLTEKIRNDIVAILIVLALAVTEILKPDEALSGFGSEPAIIVVSIFIMSGAFHQTGLADIIGSRIGKLAGRNYNRALIVIMISVEILSAFTHHLTTTAVMLPIVLSFCREKKISASKLLIPLSFSASLGTTIAIIGAPAFLIASNFLRSAGRPGLSIFSIAPIGLALSAAGTIYMLLIGKHLLPNRKSEEAAMNHFRLINYFTEIKILPASPFVGKTLSEVKSENRYQFTVAGWMREGKRIRRNFNREKLNEGDILLVHTTPEDLVAFRKESGIELHPVEKFGGDSKSESDVEDIAENLIQAVVSPNSDLIGRTLKDIDFRNNYGAIVVGLWRSESFLNQELSLIKLKAGDVLVLEGDPESIARIANDPAFLVMMPFHGEMRLKKKARLTGIIMLATILAASFKIFDLQIVMLGGAIAMVLTGCVSIRRAYKSIDTKVYVFIAGAIPLGLAIQKTGTDKLLAGWLNTTVGDWNQMFILLLLFFIVAIITQFMSDAATTAFFAPVAIALANMLGKSPEPFVITVAMAAAASFLTPIGHHGNLLVYGPGQYKFKDFLIVGTPLTIIIAVIVIFLSQLLWKG